MLKKFLFVFFGLFLFLVLSLILIILNLNYILNDSRVKSRLSEFLKVNYKIELKYDEIKIKFLQKKAFFKNLIFKSPEYEVILPEGNFIFSFRKILKFNFIPEEIEVRNSYLKIYKSKKPFRLKDLVETFSKLHPFYLNAKNVTLDYETPLEWIKFKKLNLKLKVDRYQALYELESRADLFESANFKGRFDYKNLFSENSLEIKNLNFSNIKKLADYGISGTSLDIKSEIVFEKDTLNLAFVILHPYIFLKRAPYEKLLGGYIEGVAFSNKYQTEIKLNPLIINYPKINGSLDLIKNNNGYKVLINAKELKFSDLENVLLKVFSENKDIRSLLTLLKGGEFYNIKIETSGKNIEDIFKIKNLVLKSTVNQGKIKISELPFDFENIQGEITFEKNILNFKGNASINKEVLLKVKKLDLDFSKKNPDLFIEGNFYSSAQSFINILSLLVKDPEYFKKYEFKGDLEGAIRLNGEITNIKGRIDLFLNNLLVKTPYSENPILIEKGTLAYNFDKIWAEKVSLSSKNIYIKDLTGELSLKNLDMDLIAKNIWISQKFIEELSEKNEKLKDFISKYHASFEEVYLDYLKYKDNLSFFKNEKSKKTDYLDKDILAKGMIKGLAFQIPYKEEIFRFKTEELPFQYEKGKLNFDNTLVNAEDSIFRVKGKINNRENIITLEGTGELNKRLKYKIEKLSSLFSEVSIKTPVRFESFKIIYNNSTFTYLGEHGISGHKLNLNLNKEKDSLNLNIVFLNKSSDLKIQIKNKSTQTDLKVEGNLELKDLSEVFDFKKHEFAGRLETSLNLSIPNNLKKKNIKSLINFYLDSNLISQESYLKLNDVKYIFNGTPVFSIDLLGNFTEEKLKIWDFSLKWDSHQIKGNLILSKKKKYLYLTGNLSGKSADLRKFIKKEKPSEESKGIFQILDKIPLIANINFHVDNLILPTSHQFENINGEITFDNRNKLFMVEIPEFQFCGLNGQAIYQKNSNNQYTFVEVFLSKGDFLDFFSCLYPEEMPEAILEGSYKLKGYFYAEGDKEKIVKNGEGALDITSKKGYIYRAPVLARVLAFLSPIDLFRGKVTNLETNLLEYEELNIGAVIENSTLKLYNGFLSAIGFRLFGEGNVDLSKESLNLTFYVSPFKTIDVIIEKIPYLGKLILGKPRMLVYLPLKVIGPYRNYNIIPLHPSSIGKGVFDFVFRIFGIPEEFFQKVPQVQELKKQKMLEFKEKYEKTRESP
ncbi:MAG: hypothetical protein C0190_04220 [Thermodesulfobacterium geofontis]|uniref:Uncharacterized protein n=2 Tax=Thermodesulfobacterium geofontis TaxID=1295609 RepID=A0A2N7PNE8_9BACT|nr:MAG: hypothetical protein C0190_04220 [Thermodesulfobacterium geofontis]